MLIIRCLWGFAVKDAKWNLTLKVRFLDLIRPWLQRASFQGYSVASIGVLRVFRGIFNAKDAKAQKNPLSL